MRPRVGVWGSVFVVLTVSAGCVDEAAGTGIAVGDGLVDEVSGAVRGRVVDAEIVPVEGADIQLVGTEQFTQTDANGSFEFRSLAPQEYRVAVSKEGYAPAETSVNVAAGAVTTITLSVVPVARNVPYHETQLFVAFLDCSWAITSATFPCVPIDRITGQNITGDQSAWKFQIPAPGLSNVLHEMTWTSSQATGKEMKVVITEPGQPVFVGGVTRFFLLNEGPSPLRAWLVPGVVAIGGDVPFDGNESVKYDAYIRGSPGNSTVPEAAIYVNQRAENWFTFFYNRPGNPEFSALPDT